MLTLEHVTYTQAGFALSAHWALEPEARVAIVGPSGAGKSTLLALIGGFLAPSAGRILWQGKDITDAAPSARPLANLFQEGNLFPHLTVFENAALGVNTRLKLSAAETARVQGALERVGLAGFGARKPAQLSGGQASRAALARALCQDRPLLLLDEPFAELDELTRQLAGDWVRDVAKLANKTLLVVTHQAEDVTRVSDRCVHL